MLWPDLRLAPAKHPHSDNAHLNYSVRFYLNTSKCVCSTFYPADSLTAPEPQLALQQRAAKKKEQEAEKAADMGATNTEGFKRQLSAARSWKSTAVRCDLEIC